MIKIASLFFSAIVLVVLALFPSGALATGNMTKVSPSPSPTALPVDSYRLFWPITAGKVMGESLYSLKILKENFRGFFVFSELKKAEYNMTLSEKRTVEAEKLFMVGKDYQNGKASLDAAQEKREKAVILLTKAEEKKRNISDVKNRLVSSFERQRDLLNYILSQVSDQQKNVIEENVSDINRLLSALE